MGIIGENATKSENANLSLKLSGGNDGGGKDLIKNIKNENMNVREIHNGRQINVIDSNWSSLQKTNHRSSGSGDRSGGAWLGGSGRLGGGSARLGGGWLSLPRPRRR